MKTKFEFVIEFPESVVKKPLRLKTMRRLLESINVLRKEYNPSRFYWPSDEPPVIRAGSVTGILSIQAMDDMDVDDLQAFVRDYRHLFPEKTEVWVDGQSPQTTTIAINAIESMAHFHSIEILTGALDLRWMDTHLDLTNIKTDIPVFWADHGTGATPIFDPCKVSELVISGTAQLRPSSDEIRLRRLTINSLDEIIGIHYVKGHLLSLKLHMELSVGVHSFKEFSSLKVLYLRRGWYPGISRKPPEIILPPSFDTLILRGFKWGVLIRGKVNYAKLIPDFYGTPGEYQFTTSPKFIWVTPTSGRYDGAFIWGNIDDYKVVDGEGWRRRSVTRDQIQTSSAAFFAAKVR
jgi:hypothetical protein